MDGSSLSNPGRMSFDRPIRSGEGSFLVGFTGFASIGSNFLPESLAIKYELLLAGKGLQTGVL